MVDRILALATWTAVFPFMAGAAGADEISERIILRHEQRKAVSSGEDGRSLLQRLELAFSVSVLGNGNIGPMDIVTRQDFLDKISLLGDRQALVGVLHSFVDQVNVPFRTGNEQYFKALAALSWLEADDPATAEVLIDQLRISGRRIEQQWRGGKIWRELHERTDRDSYLRIHTELERFKTVANLLASFPDSLTRQAVPVLEAVLKLPTAAGVALDPRNGRPISIFSKIRTDSLLNKDDTTGEVFWGSVLVASAQIAPDSVVLRNRLAELPTAQLAKDLASQTNAGFALEVLRANAALHQPVQELLDLDEKYRASGLDYRRGPGRPNEGLSGAMPDENGKTESDASKRWGVPEGMDLSNPADARKFWTRADATLRDNMTEGQFLKFLGPEVERGSSGDGQLWRVLVGGMDYERPEQMRRAAGLLARLMDLSPAVATLALEATPRLNDDECQGVLIALIRTRLLPPEELLTKHLDALMARNQPWVSRLTVGLSFRMDKGVVEQLKPRFEQLLASENVNDQYSGIWAVVCHRNTDPAIHDLLNSKRHGTQVWKLANVALSRYEKLDPEVQKFILNDKYHLFKTVAKRLRGEGSVEQNLLVEDMLSTFEVVGPLCVFRNEKFNFPNIKERREYFARIWCQDEEKLRLLEKERSATLKSTRDSIDVIFKSAEDNRKYDAQLAEQLVFEGSFSGNTANTDATPEWLATVLERLSRINDGESRQRWNKIASQSEMTKPLLELTMNYRQFNLSAESVRWLIDSVVQQGPKTEVLGALLVHLQNLMKDDGARPYGIEGQIRQLSQTIAGMETEGYVALWQFALKGGFSFGNADYSSIAQQALFDSPVVRPRDHVNQLKSLFDRLPDNRDPLQQKNGYLYGQNLEFVCKCLARDGGVKHLEEFIKQQKGEGENEKAATAITLLKGAGPVGAAALGRIAARRKKPGKYEFLAAMELVEMGLNNAAAMPSILELLESDDPYLVMLAAFCVSEAGVAGREAVPLLVSKCEDFDKLLADDKPWSSANLVDELTMWMINHRNPAGSFLGGLTPVDKEDLKKRCVEVISLAIESQRDLVVFPSEPMVRLLADHRNFMTAVAIQQSRPDISTVLSMLELLNKKDESDSEELSDFGNQEAIMGQVVERACWYFHGGLSGSESRLAKILDEGTELQKQLAICVVAGANKTLISDDLIQRIRVLAEPVAGDSAFTARVCLRVLGNPGHHVPVSPDKEPSSE